MKIRIPVQKLPTSLQLHGKKDMQHSQCASASTSTKMPYMHAAQHADIDPCVRKRNFYKSRTKRNEPSLFKEGLKPMKRPARLENLKARGNANFWPSSRRPQGLTAKETFGQGRPRKPAALCSFAGMHMCEKGVHARAGSSPA